MLESPSEAPNIWNIHQRINWVRSQIGYVQKTKTVQGQYKAVTHDEVTAMLRPYMIKSGVVTEQTRYESTFVDTKQTTKNGTPIFMYTARYKISFVNIDNQEDKIVLYVESQALDSGDKAPGKAMSYAKKYAYLKTFDIETGEDEESRIEASRKTPEYISEGQAKEIADYIVEKDISSQFLKWLAGPPIKCQGIPEIQTNALEIVRRQIAAIARAKANREKKT